MAAELPAPLPDIPDAPTVYPDGELGRMVRLGEEIIYNTNTHPLTKELVGNDLKCTNCHLDGGKEKTLGTFIGTATSFPAYSPREKTVQTLQNRINNCFMRSMNGTRPIIDTEASVAMAAYVTWLSSGLPINMNPKKPVNPFFTKVWWGKKWVVPMLKAASHENYKNGEKLYTEKCADCHQADGLGLATEDENYPPVWGARSFNTGAGLSKPEKLPTYLLYNMPLGDPNLTKQEAVDIAIYVTAQPRPDFDLNRALLPREQMGYYNSNVLSEKHTVQSNFAKWGLDVDELRGEN
jgi:thiosulfate dehydrogenase